MKPNQSLAVILSTAAVTGGVLLGTMNPSQAIGCPFSKAKGTTAVTSGDAPTLTAKKLNLAKMGILAAGMATVAGITAAGIAYKVRRASQTDAVASEVPMEHPEVESDSLAGEVLYAPIAQETSGSSVDKDLTLVG